MSSHDLDVQRAVDETVLHPPAMHIGVDGVLKGGRRRERRRLLTTAGMSFVAVLLVVAGWFGLGDGADVLGDRIAPASVPTWDSPAPLDATSHSGSSTPVVRTSLAEPRCSAWGRSGLW